MKIHLLCSYTYCHHFAWRILTDHHTIELQNMRKAAKLLPMNYKNRVGCRFARILIQEKVTEPNKVIWSYFCGYYDLNTCLMLNRYFFWRRFWLKYNLLPSWLRFSCQGDSIPLALCWFFYKVKQRFLLPYIMKVYHHGTKLPPWTGKKHERFPLQQHTRSRCKLNEFKRNLRSWFSLGYKVNKRCLPL